METKEIIFINNQSGENYTKAVVDIVLEEKVVSNEESIHFENPEEQ